MSTIGHAHASPVATGQGTPAHFNPYRPVSPSGRMHAHVHIDLVGPLPPCQGFTYLLTCVDRFTCWPEVVPLSDITAISVAHAITTDRGSQSESNLWQQLMCLLGSTRIRTTAYYPAANGLVERFHHQLKASLMSVTTSTRWIEALPMVLMAYIPVSKRTLDAAQLSLYMVPPC